MGLYRRLALCFQDWYRQLAEAVKVGGWAFGACAAGEPGKGLALYLIARLPVLPWKRYSPIEASLCWLNLPDAVA